MSEILDNLPDISYIDNYTLEELKNEMVTNYCNFYKEITGQDITLGLADPDRIKMYAAAVLIYQCFIYVDRAGKMNNIKYSYDEYLDNLAAGKGQTRNKATAAKTTIQFTLSEAKPMVMAIGIGTRVTNGTVYFQTTDYAEIAIGNTYVDVTAECIEVGKLGNDYETGELNILVDTLPYSSTVSNIVKTYGGTDKESNESLADKVYLAPSSYSTAGPADAYVYWTKSYSTEVGDVKVSEPSDAVVNIRVLKSDGSIPNSNFLDAIEEYLMNENIRPLTDKVVVEAPTTVTYNIELIYFINRSNRAKANKIQTDINNAVEAYKTWQGMRVGRDINPSELIKLIVNAGAKRVVITSPLYTELDNISVAVNDICIVTYGGLEDD